MDYLIDLTLRSLALALLAGALLWIAHVKSGEYQNYYERNYANRAE